jgi:hypothetical protein
MNPALEGRICEERACLESAERSIILTDSDGSELLAVLCAEHASKIHSGDEFDIVRKTGEPRVVVIDGAFDDDDDVASP